MRVAAQAGAEHSLLLKTRPSGSDAPASAFGEKSSPRSGPSNRVNKLPFAAALLASASIQLFALPGLADKHPQEVETKPPTTTEECVQTDPSVCILPDDVQEGLRELYDDVSQIKTDIGSLKNLEQMLEAVSAAQEQGNTLSKGLRDDVNQMKADITRLKQTLEKVSKAQGEEPPLFINILIVLVTSFIAYQILIIWLKTRNLDRMDKKLDKALALENMDSPNWLEQIRSVATIMVGIITIPTLVFSLLKYTSTSTSSPDMRPPQQEQSLEAASSPAEGPL